MNYLMSDSDSGIPYSSCYSISHYVLASEYAIFLFVELVIVVNHIRYQNLSKGWQKSFHICLLLGLLGRTVFMAIQPLQLKGYIHLEDRVNYVMNAVPAYLFFTDYSVVLFLWVEIYHANPLLPDLNLRRFKKPFYVTNAVMYVVLCAFYAAFFISKADNWDPVALTTGPWMMGLQLLTASIYLLLAVFYAHYGGQIYRKLRGRTSSLIVSRTRSVAGRVLLITLIVALVFSVRTAFTAWAAFSDLSGSFCLTDWLYFTTLEVIPLGLLLVVLHKRNGGSVADSYQGISE